jgi:group I intron endonuclease
MHIYKITNTVNDKIYIGQTTTTLKERFYRHCTYNEAQMLISRAIKKHGSENFSIESIYECDNIDELNRMEEFYISHFNSLTPNGYNILRGGNNRTMREETKRKISIKNSGVPKSKEHGEKIKRRMLEIDPDYYKKLTKKRKIKPFTSNQRNNLSKNKKNKHSEYVGVNKENNNFRCEFYYMGKRTSKSFKNEVAAAHYYDFMLQEIGESPINFPDDVWSETKLEQFRSKPRQRESKFFGVKKIIGVKGDKYNAMIWLNGKNNYLGTYENEIDAAKSVDIFLNKNGKENRNHDIIENLENSTL